jgi:hypothetical protein
VLCQRLSIRAVIQQPLDDLSLLTSFVVTSRGSNQRFAAISVRLVDVHADHLDQESHRCKLAMKRRLTQSVCTIRTIV